MDRHVQILPATAGAATAAASTESASATTSAAATALALTGTATLRRLAEVADEAHVDVIQLRRGRGDEVEVLDGAVLVREREQVEQRLRGRVQAAAGDLVVGERKPGGRIDDRGAERREIAGAL